MMCNDIPRMIQIKDLKIELVRVKYRCELLRLMNFSRILLKFIATVLTLYMFAALNAPHSGENFRFFASQSVCSHTSGGLCTRSDEGTYFYSEKIDTNECVGSHPGISRCSSINGNTEATSYMPSRDGYLTYRLNGAVIGDNFEGGIQKLMLMNSFISASTIFITFFLLNNSLKIAYQAALLISIAIPENLFHVGSIAPIGIAHVSVFSFLVLFWSLLKSPVCVKSRSIAWFSLAVFAFQISIRRIDQLVVIAVISVLTCLARCVQVIYRNFFRETKFSYEAISIFRETLLILSFLLACGTVSLSSTDIGMSRTFLPVVSNALRVGDPKSNLIDVASSPSGNVLYEMIAQPYYFFLDLVPSFWSISNSLRNVLSFLIFIILLSALVYIGWKIELTWYGLVTLVSLFFVFITFDYVGASYGPRLELRYIVAPLFFMVYVLMAENFDRILHTHTVTIKAMFFVLFVLNFVGTALYTSNDDYVFLLSGILRCDLAILILFCLFGSVLTLVYRDFMKLLMRLNF